MRTSGCWRVQGAGCLRGRRRGRRSACCVTPAFLRNETAAAPLPPVASIGSISSTSVVGDVGRELLVVGDRARAWPRRGTTPRCPIRASGRSRSTPSAMPSPARRIGHQRHLPREDVAGHLLHRRLHRPRLGGPVARDLVHHQRRDLVEQRAELAMVGGEVAQLGELGLHDGMVDDDDVRVGHALRFRRRLALGPPAASARSRFMSLKLSGLSPTLGSSGPTGER